MFYVEVIFCVQEPIYFKTLTIQKRDCTSFGQPSWCVNKYLNICLVYAASVLKHLDIKEAKESISDNDFLNFKYNNFP